MVAKYLNAFCLFFVLIACGAKPKPIPSKPYIFSVIDPTTKELYAGKIKEAYQNILGKRGFSGSILVAKNGEILFEDYQGLYDVKSKTPITPTTPFHIASTSKTFTAMAILKLWEEGKIDLEKTLNPIRMDSMRAIHEKGFLGNLLNKDGSPNAAFFEKNGGLVQTGFILDFETDGSVNNQMAKLFEEHKDKEWSKIPKKQKKPSVNVLASKESKLD